MDFLVNLDVDDLERGVDFYSSLFGLQVGRRLGGFAVELLGGPAPIYLLHKDAGSAATPEGNQHRHYGPWVRGWRSPSRPKTGAGWRCWPTPSVTASA